MDITSTTAICYNPNSDVSYWGASIQISPEAGIATNTTYQVTGEVADYQGNKVSINVTVVTGAEIDATATPVVRAK